VSAGGSQTGSVIYLGRVYTPLKDGGWLDLPHGAIVVNEAGEITAVGPGRELAKGIDRSRVVDGGTCLITPGLVDCHQHLSHFHWMRLIPNLQEWLREIYRLEEEFADAAFSEETARSFFTELVRNGTTTCCVHGPYFAEATNAAFEVASTTGLRVIMGMNASDKDLPNSLAKDSSVSTREAAELCERWDYGNDGLLSYCFTVRPGYCASAELLAAVAREAATRNARVQCHLGEDVKGREQILGCFPEHATETGMYDAFGLLDKRTIMAHGVHLSDAECELLHLRGVGIAHCPRANLLAGGRQMDLRKIQQVGIEVGLGTDLGAGKGLSMFRTMEDALKVTPSLSVHDLFRLATTDGAKVLGLHERIGTLEPGMDADFVFLAPKIEGNAKECYAIEDVLSALVFRGDDRDVRAAYVRGKRIDPAGAVDCRR
jgi:guanine deaminase